MNAAEKLGRIPPWTSVVRVSMPYDGHWEVSGHIADARKHTYDTLAGAYQAARLTRPLPSWEPAEDCALPVEGWKVRKTATSTSPDNRWMVAGADGRAVAGRYFPTRRAAIVWAWTEAEHTDGTVATDGLEARVSKVEGVLARICPEADEQTDGKGRTLVQITAQLEDFYRWREVANTAIQSTQDKVDRLIAAHVPVPAKVNVRSDAASTNEAMTEAAASDEGWREMLVSRAYPGWMTWICDPTEKWLFCNGKWEHSETTTTRRVIVPDNAESAKARRTCPPPPNLAEWWKPGADTAYHGNLADIADAVPSTYRVGDDLAAWVRNLASAHDTALKDMARYRETLATCNEHMGTLRTQLAAAQAATVGAEGRAATARRHAADAEAKLSALRADIENVRASLGK